MLKTLAILLAIFAAAVAGVRLFSVSYHAKIPPYPEKEIRSDAQDAQNREPQRPAVSSRAATTSTAMLQPAVQKQERVVQIQAPVSPAPLQPLPMPVFAVPRLPIEPLALPAATSAPVLPPMPPPLPPLNLEQIFSAVVKIECPSEDRKGKYVGSGFVLPGGTGTIVSAAHLLMVSGSDTCTIIFPNKNRAPVHWLTGTISEDRAAIRRRHDEEGIDVAMLTLLPLSEYPEARAVFPHAYPFIPYPVCEDPDMIGDALIHFGYPSNFLNQSYLSVSDGTAIAYADINGIETLFNQDQTETYKSPIFAYLTDKRQLHPYMVSRVPSFYGDSGGLAFNVTKQCILGPQRGGTIGGGAGENISIFPLLGWPATRSLLP